MNGTRNDDATALDLIANSTGFASEGITAMTIHHDFTTGCCGEPNYAHHSNHCRRCGKPPYIPDWIIADRIAYALSSIFAGRGG